MSENNTNEKKVKQKEANVAVDKRTFSLMMTSILSVVVLIVIVILFNIVVDKILGKHLTFDFSANGQNSISATTKDFINTLPEGSSIRIVGLFDVPESLAGTPLEYIVPLLEDYEKQSNGKVTVEYINPDNYPYIITELDPTGVYDIGASTGLYAICYEGKVDTVDPYSDCFIFENQYNASYGTEIPVPVSNISESAFTNTMVNLTNGYSHHAYLVEDSRVTSYSNQIKLMLDNLGIEVSVLDYGDSEFVIPADCELLILNNLQQDITEHMAEEINQYIGRNGKLIITSDYAVSISTNFENLNTRVLNDRGLNIDNFMIYENDPNFIINQDQGIYNVNLSNDFASFSNTNLIGTQFSMSVSRVTTKYDSSINVLPVLTTSDQATRVEYDEVAGGWTTFGTASTYNVAMYSTGTSTNHENFEIYVLGTTTLSSDNYISSLSDPNVVLFRNIVKSTLKIEKSYDIASKNLSNYGIDTTKVSMSNVSALIVVLVAVVPLALIVIGTVVYTRRKHL